MVYESTVYPGVTEDYCGPILARESGLTCGRDFFLGYSPERINPGDREHTLERVTKIVAGQTPEVAERLREVYGTVNGGNIFVAQDIKTAEAAKVIENAQRDINIAFINEVAVICSRLGLSPQDVLNAAGTFSLNVKPRTRIRVGACPGKALWRTPRIVSATRPPISSLIRRPDRITSGSWPSSRAQCAK